MKKNNYILTGEEKKKIDHWIAKFPVGKQQSAVLMALRIMQDQHGWLHDEHLDAVAAYLNIPNVTVYEVASFYSMYKRVQKGKYVLKVCASISCHLCQAHDVIHHIEKKLKIKLGETTKDGLFTLEEAECLAACTQAPVLIINDVDTHVSVTKEKVDQLIQELQQQGSV